VDGWGHDGPAVHTADGRLFSLADTKTITVAKAFFLADSIALTPRVTLDLGFKGVDLLHAGRNNLPGTQGACISTASPPCRAPRSMCS
jgi:iron complex outermembrane receptor protein